MAESFGFSQKDLSFLQGKLKEYYSKNRVEAPQEIHAREFGIGDFGKKIAARHMSFETGDELASYLKEVGPPYISCSLSLYKFPAKTPMERKGQYASDLVYEFDADDIPTPCKGKHDSWKCGKCGASGKGASESCHSCLAPVKAVQWFCTECINEAKKQAIKLVSVLEDDFDAGKFISVNFSGNAGFHVHVSGDCFGLLGKDARIELLNYLSMFEFQPKYAGFTVSEDGALAIEGKEVSTMKGQKARYAAEVRKIFMSDVETIAAAGAVPKSRLPGLFSDKEKLSALLDEIGRAHV